MSGVGKKRVKSINEIWAQADRIVNNPRFKGDDERIGEIASRYEQNILNQNLSAPAKRRFRMQYPTSVYRDGGNANPYYKASLSGTAG